MKFKDILKNKTLLEKEEVPAEILKMLGLKKKGFEDGAKGVLLFYNRWRNVFWFLEMGKKHPYT